MAVPLVHLKGSTLLGRSNFHWRPSHLEHHAHPHAFVHIFIVCVCIFAGL